MLRSFLALGVLLTLCLPCVAQTPTPRARAQTRAPAIDPAYATFLANGVWRWIPNAEASATDCKKGFYKHFYRYDGRLRYDYSDAGSFLGGLFTLGLTSLRTDDYVTRVAARDGEIEVDIASSRNGGLRKRLVFERKDENLINHTKYGEIKRGNAILNDAGMAGGLFKRCFETRR